MITLKQYLLTEIAIINKHEDKWNGLKEAERYLILLKIGADDNVSRGFCTVLWDKLPWPFKQTISEYFESQ